MKNWRINFILFLIFIFGAVIISRLFLIQVEKGDYYKAMAKGMNLDKEQNIERGEVFFKNGEPLAINMDWSTVYASPKEVKEKEGTAQKLSEILNMNESFILEKVEKDSLYEVIKKRLNDDEISKIKEANLVGIYIEKENGRYYPQENLASQLVGFLDANKTGQYGIEGYYDEVLKGERTNQKTDLYLTIDYSLQFTAEKLLAEAQKNLNIESGQIVVMDPRSGKILAMANFPDFNPNQYSEEKDLNIFQNSVTQKIFEPGSVFKPFTMSAALQEQRVTPETTYIDKGQVQIAGHTISNYGLRSYGESTMTNVLEKSINTGAVFAEQQLGQNLFLKYVENFGFFESSGIDLEEIYSDNKELKKGYEFNFATASFGQGIEITPIQLVRAYCAIANGGKLIKPYIVDKIVTGDNVIETSPKIEDEKVISPKTVSQITSMLVSVIDNGFAKAAKIPGYYVAGKTGTAQISWSALGVSDKKGYSDKTWQSFIGFAPAFNPQFVILVKLDTPSAKTAQYSALPIFHDLAKYIIDYYQIPPDFE